MYKPVLKGTYYEMGHKYGDLLFKQGFKISEQSDEKLRFGKESEAEVKRVFPEILRRPGDLQMPVTLATRTCPPSS